MCGKVPKSQFPGLLKSKIDAFETKNSNLVAGFAACGIVPLDRTRVLQKLPDYIDLSMDFSAASWSSSIIDVLKTTRCPEVRERTRVRGKKINVEPGKSVGADDSDSESSNDGSNSYESSDEEVDDNVVQSHPTASNGNYVSISSPPAIDCTCNNESASKYQVDEFIVARFKSNKRGLLYVGKILKLNEHTLEVSFMRKIIGKNDVYFSFSNVLDECEIDYKDVVCSITKPIDLRRNRFKFLNLNLDYDILN